MTVTGSAKQRIQSNYVVWTASVTSQSRIDETRKDVTAVVNGGFALE